MEKLKIVVTGGSGMVGISLKRIMPNAIYLSSKDFNLITEKGVIDMYETHRPDVVIHLAAKVGGIIDNIEHPSTYFSDNILMNTLLVEYARFYKVERFIGILSTCIFPDKVDSYPMAEEILHLGPPTPTNFSYGYAKRSHAVHIDACNKEFGTKYQYLTPCNLYGEHDKFGNNSHFVAALIKKIHEAKIKGGNKIELFGTGTPLRQFMHSDDLALIIKDCIEQDIYESFNVATEQNVSILEIARIAIKACGVPDMLISFDSTKPDGQFRKDVSIDKLRSIFPEFKAIGLYEGIKETYENLTKNGYLDHILNK